MFRRSTRSVAGLRACPVCRSEAISEMRADGLGEDVLRLCLRCGVCDTWRARTLEARRAQAIERRLTRMLERGRRQISDDLRYLELAGTDSVDFSAVRKARHAAYR